MLNIDSKSSIFFYSLLSFIIGIFVASFLSIGFSLILLGFAISVILAIDRKTRLAGGFLLLFLLGILRCNAGFQLSKNSAAKLADGESHIIKGIISEEPDERLGYVNLTVKLKNFDGKILARTEKYSGYNYGDEIIMEGKVEIPQEDDDFSHRGYLLRYGIQAEMFMPDISLASAGNGSKAYSAILSAKQYFRQKIEQSTAGKEADFLSALLLGYKRNISQYWKNVFAKTGTSHIISISGLHISIIVGMLLLALLGAGIHRKTAFWIISAGLIAYAVFVGLSASVLRASVMGFLALLAVRAGRLAKPQNALALAAAAMLAINPLLLRYDAGFQLSFLSIIGIFYLWPILENWTEKIPNPFKLRSALNLSLSAQIITLPLVIYYFKLISLIAPIANLIIVPLIPLIFLISAIPLAFVFLPPMFLKILFLPYKEFSRAILWGLEKMSKIPAVEISINWVWVVVVYVSGFVFVIIETNRSRRN